MQIDETFELETKVRLLEAENKALIDIVRELQGAGIKVRLLEAENKTLREQALSRAKDRRRDVRDYLENDNTLKTYIRALLESNDVFKTGHLAIWECSYPWSKLEVELRPKKGDWEQFPEDDEATIMRYIAGNYGRD